MRPRGTLPTRPRHGQRNLPLQKRLHSPRRLPQVLPPLHPRPLRPKPHPSQLNNVHQTTLRTGPSVLPRGRPLLPNRNSRPLSRRQSRHLRFRLATLRGRTQLQRPVRLPKIRRRRRLQGSQKGVWEQHGHVQRPLLQVVHARTVHERGVDHAKTSGERGTVDGEQAEARCVRLHAVFYEKCADSVREK